MTLTHSKMSVILEVPDLSQDICNWLEPTVLFHYLHFNPQATEGRNGKICGEELV